MADASIGTHALFKQAHRATITCKDCSKPFAHSGSRGRLPVRCATCTEGHNKRAPTRYDVVCKTCGGQSVRSRKAEYCSKRCQRRASPVASGRSKFVERKCRACLSVMTIRGDNDRVFCGDVCRADWRWVTAKPASYTIVRWPPKAQLVRLCPGCGCTIPEKGSHRCQPCRTKSRNASKLLSRRNARKAAIKSGRKAAERKARKLKLRGVTVEMVNPLVVLARDKWVCQLCGIKTPKSLRGTYDARAPEVDHIVPIAAGGEHSYRNTQCACRRCNLAKADTIQGQMRLFG